MGRVLFSPKSEPAVDWSEIESRLQEISTGPSDLPVEPSATLAHDLALANDPPVTGDRPVINPGDPLDMLSLLAAIPANRS